MQHLGLWLSLSVSVSVSLSLSLSLSLCPVVTQARLISHTHSALKDLGLSLCVRVCVCVCVCVCVRVCLSSYTENFACRTFERWQSRAWVNMVSAGSLPGFYMNGVIIWFQGCMLTLASTPLSVCFGVCVSQLE